MTDDPDLPHDSNLKSLVGGRIPDNSGRSSRMLMALAATRRQQALQLRERGDDPGADRQEHDAACLERRAERIRDPREAIGGPLVVGIGGEVVAAAEDHPGSFDAMIQ